MLGGRQHITFVIRVGRPVLMVLYDNLIGNLHVVDLLQMRGVLILIRSIGVVLLKGRVGVASVTVTLADRVRIYGQLISES